MENNNVIRFISISKDKKGAGAFANFKVKGIKNGVAFTASVSVDLNAANVDFSDPMEKIVTDCAHLAVREFKTSHFQFEGIQAV